MTTLPIGRYRFFQKIQPLFLLSKMTNESTTGCWQIFSPSASWSIYLEKGQLIYAGYTDKMFDLLYTNLQRLRGQIPTLHSEVDKQLQAMFEAGIDNEVIPNAEYLAICWLVGQKYMTPVEAGILIEQLALEVLEPFLSINQGSYEFSPQTFLDDMPKFCHLDLRLLVEQCQNSSNNQRHVQPSSASQQTLQFLKTKARRYKTKIKQQLKIQDSYKAEQSIPEKPFPFNIKQENFHRVDTKIYKVFCIDDSPTIINAIKSFLDEEIFSVTGVTDSMKALMQVIRVKPDIILLDIEMPSVDGYELCSLLRKHSYFQKTPIIMVTGRTGLIDKAKAKMVKATGYLTKPFTEVDLLKIIFQHLDLE